MKFRPFLNSYTFCDTTARIPFISSSNMTIIVLIIIILLNPNVEGRKKSPPITEISNENQSFIEDSNDKLPNISFSSGYNTILIGAFNLRKFGMPKINNTRVLNALVKIISRYDLIAVSEITDRFEIAIKILMGKVNYESEHPYHYVVSFRVGRTNNKEQYGLIYRPEKITIKNHFVYDDSQNDPFTREPLIAELIIKATGQMFALVTIHVKPSEAVAEIDALVEVQDWIDSKLKIKDTVILGDFNAGCTYVPKKAWKTIRLRTMERFTWLIGNEVDTTVGKTNCAYDRIVISGQYLKDNLVPGSARSYRFDTAYGLDEESALLISDHYPVEFLLNLNADYVSSATNMESSVQGKQTILLFYTFLNRYFLLF